MINDIVRKLTGYFTFRYSSDVRTGCSELEATKDDTEHDSNDDSTCVVFVTIFDVLPLEIATKIECIGIESIDGNKKETLTNTSFEYLLDS
jgi:hypothetical protein